VSDGSPQQQHWPATSIAKPRATLERNGSREKPSEERNDHILPTSNGAKRLLFDVVDFWSKARKGGAEELTSRCSTIHLYSVLFFTAANKAVATH
jgi:hypothetical protein